MDSCGPTSKFPTRFTCISLPLNFKLCVPGRKPPFFTIFLCFANALSLALHLTPLKPCVPGRKAGCLSNCCCPQRNRRFPKGILLFQNGFPLWFPFGSPPEIYQPKRGPAFGEVGQSQAPRTGLSRSRCPRVAPASMDPRRLDDLRRVHRPLSHEQLQAPGFLGFCVREGGGGGGGWAAVFLGLQLWS